MDTHRRNAVLAGVFYILGTVMGLVGMALSQPLRDGPDPLAAAAASANQVTLAALCTLLMGLSLAMVPVVLYPVLRRHSEVLALGYVVFRGALETVAYFVTAIAWLLLPTLGRLSVEALASSGFEAAGALLAQTGEAGSLFSVVFCLGGLMLYAVLFRSGLVPRWISVAGLATLVPYLAVDLLAVFNALDSMSSTAMLLQLPLALQEMILAVWLIAKGFNPSALTVAPAPRVPSHAQAY